MSKRIQLFYRIKSEERLPAKAEPGDALDTLAQLVSQIDDALLVIEHPRLADRIFVALRATKAA